MNIRKIILGLFALQSCIIGHAQDTSGLTLIRYDTLQLSLTAPKVLAYKTRHVIFLMDFPKAKQLLSVQAKYGLLKELAKHQLENVEKQIKKSDTAFLDDTVFTKWMWVPFNQLLCELLNTKSCIIEDLHGNMYNTIIRMHGDMWGGNYFVWSGWRYFLPKQFEYFFECTESES